MGGQASHLLCCRYQLPLSIFLRVPPTQSIFFLGDTLVSHHGMEYYEADLNDAVPLPELLRYSNTKTINAPSGIGNGSWILNLPHNATNGMQVCFSRSSANAHIFCRSNNNGNWTDWMPVYDQLLLSNSTMLGQLGTALGVIKYNGFAVYDANDTSLKSGIYYLNGSSTNTPVSGQPTMLLIMGDGLSKLQLAGTINSDPTYYIRTSSSNGFTAWKQITMA